MTAAQLRLQPHLPTRLQALMRVLLSHYVLNGLSVALGLLLISSGVHAWLGAAAASAAGVGVIVAVPPDRQSPRRGKFWQMLPAPLLGTPLFLAVQLLHNQPLWLGVLVVSATFLSFLGMAWGKRGAPLAFSAMFAVVFSMAVPTPIGPAAHSAALTTTAFFALGAVLYLPYAVLANAVLNGRYRVQLLADVLLSLAALMRLQARQFTPARTEAAATPGATLGTGQATRAAASPLTLGLLRRHAALAEQLQAARDLILEAPSTPYRQRLAGVLMQVLEMRDHLLASELDLDSLRSQPGHAPLLQGQQEVLMALAHQVEALADALLRWRQPALFKDLSAQLRRLLADPALAVQPGQGFTPGLLARGLTQRVLHIHEETLRLVALARGEAEPDLAVVRAKWQMFVSPTTWSWQPLGTLWQWDAPPLRHALRAALAIAVGYSVSRLLPWGPHAYWVLLTIVVVLRGSFSQTLERRNSRVAGTALGCVLALGVLSAGLSPLGLILCVTLAQALAHGFALRRYWVAAVAATVLGLVQAHMLSGGESTTLALFERVADTLIGTAIAWAFAYVLPSWERTQIPALVRRTLQAQARHAEVALTLGQLQAVDNAPELAWRLARREAYDSLSALVQATQRSMSEPRAVRPPLQPLEHLQARSYQLLAQLTAIKTLLVQRRGQTAPAPLQAALAQSTERLCAILAPAAPGAPTAPDAPAQAAEPVTAPPPAGPSAESSPWFDPPPGPQQSDLSPWLLRRLRLSVALAERLRQDADQVLGVFKNDS